METRRVPRFNRDDRPRGEDRGGEKRSYTPRGDRPNFSRDEARPARKFSDRKFGEKKPYAAREGGVEKRPYTPRGEGFRKEGDRPRGDRPYGARPQRDGDRPERKFGGDKKFSRGAPDRGTRKDFGDRPDRGDLKPWQKRDATSPDHVGRNSRHPRRREFRKRVEITDKPRYDKPREESRRGEDAGPHFVSGRNSTVPARTVRNSSARANAAAPGRSIRATTRDPLIEMPIGRAATMRTTARSSPGVRHSAAAASIASASPISRSAHRGRRAKRNPASALRKWCRAPALPRAATPRNGSCRAASPSTAASSIHRRSMSPPTMSSPSTASRCRHASAPVCSCFTSRAA